MKNLRIALALLICPVIGWTQTTVAYSAEEIRFGLKIGGNYSDVYATNDNFNPDGKLGFATGLFASIPLTRHIGIQPEILYSERGFKASGTVLGSTYELSRTSSYIDMPFFLTLKSNQYFSLMIGPQYSYLLNQNNSFSNATSSIETESNIDNENTRKHTFCVVGGFDVNIGRMVVAPRIGLDTFRNTSNSSSLIPSYKYLWLQTTLGYRF